MVKVCGQNWMGIRRRSNSLHTAKNGMCGRFDVSGATSQSCKVMQAIQNVHDQLESLGRRPGVVNLICLVELKTIPQPWILDAWHQWRNTSRVLVTRDFFLPFSAFFFFFLLFLFEFWPWAFTVELYEKSQLGKRLWFWSAVFLYHATTVNHDCLGDYSLHICMPNRKTCVEECGVFLPNL